MGQIMMMFKVTNFMILDKISISDELSKAGETYEDSHLESDPTFLPMEKWTRDHPKEQIIGNPSSSVLTQAHIRAKNEFLMFIRNYVCLVSLFKKLNPK